MELELDRSNYKLQISPDGIFLFVIDKDGYWGDKPIKTTNINGVEEIVKYLNNYVDGFKKKEHATEIFEAVNRVKETISAIGFDAETIKNARKLIDSRSLSTSMMIAVSNHYGDFAYKNYYSKVILSVGIENLAEPLHSHMYGEPESGKTALQQRFHKLIPSDHTIRATGFSDKAILYENLKEGVILSLNDIIFNDSNCKEYNQMLDSNCWSEGIEMKVVVEHENITLRIPPRTLLLMNSNKPISSYDFKTVEPSAIESKITSLHKVYREEDKDEIFLNAANKDDVSNSIKVVSCAIGMWIEEPKKVYYQDEDLEKINSRTKEIGITSLRSRFKILSLAQVNAAEEGREHINKSDIDDAFKLLEEIETAEMENAEIAKCIKSVIITKGIFKQLSDDKKQSYSITNIRDTTNGKYSMNSGFDEIKRALNFLVKKKEIEYELVKVKNHRPIPCYYSILLEEQTTEEQTKAENELVEHQKEVTELEESLSRANEYSKQMLINTNCA